MSEYIRTENLKNKFNEFLTELTGTNEDYFDKLTSRQFIELKLILSDINNILTLKTTKAFANWLSDYLFFSNDQRLKLLKKIEDTKPNTNGFDIEIDEGNYKVKVEIKSIIPINNGDYYGAAQRKTILDDAIKLLGDTNNKDVSSFIKIIGLLDLGKQTDIAIQKLMTPVKKIQTEVEERIRRHSVVKNLVLMENNMKPSELSKDCVYIKKIKI